MVYVPWKVVEKYMLHIWEEALKENPKLPEPTVQEVNIQWFVWLDWVPSSVLELDRFRQMFPPGDRNQIQYRMLSEYRQQPVKRRGQESTPIASPLGDEPE